MVEAPRIRILYDRVKFTKNKVIKKASGPSYNKMNINLEGYKIKKWWFAGKYIYLFLIKKGNPSYVVRTHTMMYGKILINSETAINPKLKPFMILELDDGTILKWYLTQIKLLNPNCSSFESIIDSFQLMKFDISNDKFNYDQMVKHIKENYKRINEEMIVDLLLNQEFFPGIGNILQQEALYRCRILPMRKVKEIGFENMKCLITKLKEVIDLLYQSYLDKLEQKPHQPILQIYHKAYCPLNHKTITQYLGYHQRRTTWCPICQK